MELIGINLRSKGWSKGLDEGVGLLFSCLYFQKELTVYVQLYLIELVTQLVLDGVDEVW